MATDYTDPNRVAALLQYKQNVGGNETKKQFSENTNPTFKDVEDLINESEDYIDEYAEHSWRTKTVTDEYHNFLSSANRWGSYIDRSGYRVYEFSPKKRPLKTLTKLEGFQSSGSGWFDFVATGSLGQAMYDGDYFVDYELWEIHIFNKFPRVGQKMFRITYDYGETTVPNGIRRVCNLLVGAMINERYELYAFADKDSSPALNQAEKWREMAHRILDQYSIKEVEVI